MYHRRYECIKLLEFLISHEPTSILSPRPYKHTFSNRFGYYSRLYIVWRPLRTQKASKTSLRHSFQYDLHPQDTTTVRREILLNIFQSPRIWGTLVSLEKHLTRVVAFHMRLDTAAMSLLHQVSLSSTTSKYWNDENTMMPRKTLQRTFKDGNIKRYMSNRTLVFRSLRKCACYLVPIINITSITVDNIGPT